MTPETTRQNTPRKSLLRAARWYAQRLGWPVFPIWPVVDGRCSCGNEDCDSPGKHPIGSLAPNGVKNATTDLAVVEKWWTQCPAANIGIATGKECGLVLDVDGAVGRTTLSELERQYGSLPQTVEAVTGSGGRHIIFRHVNRTRNRVKFAPGLDTRTTGGYIVVAPSSHLSGSVYTWLKGHGPHEIALAEAPAWLIELMSTASARGGSVDPPLSTSGKVTKGGRHKFMASEAGRLRRLGHPAPVINAALAEINKEKCDPPLPDKDIAHIAASIAKYPAAEGFVSWEPPVEFDSLDLPSFPTAVLPPNFRKFVEGIAEGTQTPGDLAGLLVLGVISLALAKKIVVQVRPGWTETVNLYIVVVLPPGEGKSPVFRLIISIVRDYESAERTRMKLKVEEAKVAYKIAQSRLKDLMKKSVKAKDQEARDKAADDAKKAAVDLALLTIPELPRILANDATPEALAELLRLNNGRMGVFSAEGGGPFEVMGGKYSNDGSPNLEVYLMGHSGDHLAIDRIGRTSGTIQSPALTLALTVQPEVLAGLAAKPGFRGRGLLGRFLYGLPKSLVGKRKIDPHWISKGLRDTYDAAISRLLRIPFKLDGNGEYESAKVALNEDAYAMLCAFRAALEPRLGPEGDLHTIGDWANKLPGHIVRIAAALHAADCVDSDQSGVHGLFSPIGPDVMRRAIEVGNYFLEHARAAFQCMGTDEDTEHAKFVLAWIRRKKLTVVSKREILRAAQRRIRCMRDLEPVIEILVSRGFIREAVPSDSPGRGRPASPVYEVNPLRPVSAEAVTQRTESSDPTADEDSVASVNDEERFENSDSGEDDMVEGGSMSAAELLKILVAARVEIWSDNNQIRYRGKRRILTEQNVATIRAHRDALLNLLRLPSIESPNLPSALDLKTSLGWSVEYFSTFCKSIIGRPGPSTLQEDVAIAQAMIVKSKTHLSGDRTDRTPPFSKRPNRFTATAEPEAVASRDDGRTKTENSITASAVDAHLTFAIDVGTGGDS